MYALLLCFLAAASAAPHYDHHHRHHANPPEHRYDRFTQMEDLGSFSGEMFDTSHFWQQLETDLAEIENLLNSFRIHFPNGVSSAGVEGTEYKVKINLSGFDDKDIVVKARNGVLMVQAVHKMEDGNERNYLDVRSLPPFIDINGVWTYKDDVLTVAFPVKAKSTTESGLRTGEVENVSEGVKASREEMESTDTHIVDADVGLTELAKDNEIKTNEIPDVEATTYAVDLKDEYELVPVHYKR